MAHPHSNLVEITDNLEISIAGLAAITGVVGASKIDANREQGFRTLFQSGNIAIDSAGDQGGPVFVGFAQQDLSLAQIEEKIEADPQNSDDTNQSELAERRVFPLGFLSTEPNAQGKQLSRVNTRHKWSFIEGTAMSYIAYNTDLTTAMPADTQVKIFVKHTGVWLRD